MKMKTFKITLEFNVSLKDLKERISRQLVVWSDGRYPFTTEMMHDGLERLVRSVANHSTTPPLTLDAHITSGGGTCKSVKEIEE